MNGVAKYQNIGGISVLVDGKSNNMEKNLVEAVNRMRMIINAYPGRLPLYECCSIVKDINAILRQGNDLTEEMSQIIEDIKKQGFVVEWRDKSFVLPEIEKRDEEKRRRVAKEAEQWDFVVRRKK